MKRTRMLPILFIALTVLVAVCAAWNLYSSEDAEPGLIRVYRNGHAAELRLNMLSPAFLHFDIVDAKGESDSITAPAVSLEDALHAAGIPVEEIASVSVTAADAYSAVVTGDEVRADAAWLIVMEDGGFRLIVPSDADSRRNVRGVQRIDVA